MLDKIAVHWDFVFILGKMHPVCFDVYHAVTFLEENDVAGDFRTGCVFERVIRKSYRTQQISTLGNILSDSRIFFVERSFGGNKSNDATRSNLVQSADKEIIMDQEIMLVITFI
ncbi:hypothetical protein SDC9_208358 [bioreactor metagenome]|uniref:Uncharacterized protein n=1 Tax=bioreactor metagenome TaxID=1076179 RepID=A0A645JD86_9ZZZZ